MTRRNQCSRAGVEMNRAARTIGLIVLSLLASNTWTIDARAEDAKASKAIEAPEKSAEDVPSTDDTAPVVEIAPLILEGQALLAETTRLTDRTRSLTQEATQASAEEKIVLDHQVANAKLEYLEVIDGLIRNMMATEEAGLDSAPVHDFLDRELPTLSAALVEHIDASEAELRNVRKRRVSAEGAELAGLDEAIAREIDWSHSIYRGYLKHLAHLKALELDYSKVYEDLHQRLATRADRRAGRINLAMDKIARLNAQASDNPDNESIQEEIRTITISRKSATDGLHLIANMMDEVDLDSSEYRQLLIRATGEVTADVFKGKVAIGLLQGWLNDFREWLRTNGPGVAFKGLIFLITLLFFRLLAAIVTGILNRGISREPGGTSQLLNNMMRGLSTRAIMIFGLLVALSQVGVELGPLLAGLGIAGFIVGFALQDSLANFAAGVMILGYRPYDVDDLIEAGGVFGTVSYMSLVSTTILTLDNQTLIVPNAKIWGDVIKNVTNQNRRRVDLKFYVSHEESVSRIEKIFLDLLEVHPKVLAEPEPNVQLHKILESTLQFVVRPWVKTEDYWDVYWELTRQVKSRFEEEGIQFPHPRRDIALVRDADD
jgi:small conductance mechanosensitive channel